MMHEQNEKFNKEVESIEKQTEILELRNTMTSEKFNREIQKQIQTRRRKNQCT